MALDYSLLARDVGLKFSKCAVQLCSEGMCRINLHFKGKEKRFAVHEGGRLFG